MNYLCLFGVIWPHSDNLELKGSHRDYFFVCYSDTAILCCLVFLLLKLP